MKFGKEIVTATNEFIVNKDHWNGVPVMLFAEFFSLFSSFRWFGINILEWKIVVLEIVGNFTAVRTVVVSQYNNFSHQTVFNKIIISGEFNLYLNPINTLIRNMILESLIFSISNLYKKISFINLERWRIKKKYQRTRIVKNQKTNKWVLIMKIKFKSKILNNLQRITLKNNKNPKHWNSKLKKMLKRFFNWKKTNRNKLPTHLLKFNLKNNFKACNSKHTWSKKLFNRQVIYNKQSNLSSTKYKQINKNNW